MSHMEQPTINKPMPDYPRTPDGEYKYTTWDGRPLYFPSMTVPGLWSGPIIPLWLTSRLRRLFKRTTPSH